MGSRVELEYQGRPCKGTVVSLPKEDESGKGRYGVQCDGDQDGLLTFAAVVKLLDQASGSIRSSRQQSATAPPMRQLLGQPPENGVDSTMQAFTQWLSEMKARSNSRLSQVLGEMGVVQDGITKESAELAEYKRQSITVQQQMQSQLTDLREKLAGAFNEITSLTKQKTETDQALHGEIAALHSELAMKSSELDALKKSYSSTHQQLQNNLVQTQQQLQSINSEILQTKKRAQAVQESALAHMGEIEQSVQRFRGVLDSTGREGQSHAMQIQEDIAKLHEALTALSADFFEHKRLTLQVQTKLTSQVSQLESQRRARHNEAKSFEPFASKSP